MNGFNMFPVPVPLKSIKETFSHGNIDRHDSNNKLNLYYFNRSQPNKHPADEKTKQKENRSIAKGDNPIGIDRHIAYLKMHRNARILTLVPMGRCTAR